MSLVTNVILTADTSESEAVEWVNTHFIREDEKPFVLLNSDNAPLAGRKSLERTVCLGAFNFLDLGRLVEAIKSAPWTRPETVQLFVSQQHEEKFRAMNLGIK